MIMGESIIYNIYAIRAQQKAVHTVQHKAVLVRNKIHFMEKVKKKMQQSVRMNTVSSEEVQSRNTHCMLLHAKYYRTIGRSTQYSSCSAVVCTNWAICSCFGIFLLNRKSSKQIFSLRPPRPRRACQLPVTSLGPWLLHTRTPCLTHTTQIFSGNSSRVLLCGGTSGAFLGLLLFNNCCCSCCTWWFMHRTKYEVVEERSACCVLFARNKNVCAVQCVSYKPQQHCELSTTTSISTTTACCGHYSK